MFSKGTHLLPMAVGWLVLMLTWGSIFISERCTFDPPHQSCIGQPNLEGVLITSWSIWSCIWHFPDCSEMLIAPEVPFLSSSICSASLAPTEQYPGECRASRCVLVPSLFQNSPCLFPLLITFSWEPSTG